MKRLLTLLLPFSMILADLDQKELDQVGLKVWQNECNGTFEGLISWNLGEDFPCLGIGHFIWYPSGAEKKFEETFPSLIKYMEPLLKKKEMKVPSWIRSKKGFPWKTREAFLKDKRSKKMLQLRDLLSQTLDLQTAFLLKQFQAAEAKLAPQLTDKQKLYLSSLKDIPQGAYALIDYVNFKGTGLSLKERYRGEGWGLLQVLQQLPKEIETDRLVEEFSLSAKKVLARRVRNAPSHRNEGRWLKGWNRRLETYTKP